MKEIQATVYEAFDGKKFTDMMECQRYEEKTLGQIKYFMVRHTPDLNETGMFTRVTYLAVLPDNLEDAKAIAKNYALTVIGNGKYLSCGVQGWGCTAIFDVVPCKREDYDANLGVPSGCNHPNGEQVFIAVDKIPGLPEPFNYKKEWELR